MNFTLHNTGEINAKLWDGIDNVTRFVAGTVVWAKGQVIDWQGQHNQIDRIGGLKPTMSIGGICLALHIRRGDANC